MNGIARELKVELTVYDVNGHQETMTSLWAAPGPLHIVTGLTDNFRGFRAQLRITDPLAPPEVSV